MSKDRAPQNKKASYIYVLQLEDNKFYVGKTRNPKLRIGDHFSVGGGAKWTQRYKPVKVLEVRPSTGQCSESFVTQEYMSRHGMDNVRGGPWCNLELTDAEEEVIDKMLLSHKDCCYNCEEKGHLASECTACKRCGRSNHDIENCYARTHKNGKEILSSDEDEYYSEYEEAIECVCQRCGRANHDIAKA